MGVIKINNLTKDYGNSKGVFDLSLDINKGECFGFLGPNGAGKTTMIRHLMGFLNADKGTCEINSKDCREDRAQIQKNVGYLPGEIQLFDQMKGIQYLKFSAELRGMKDLTRMNELIKYFEFDPSGKIKKMSKGMKQKVGLVSAFMHKPDVYILDEPTSGLDPLMQGKFVDLIKQEQSKGSTILMSSHSFEEVEKTCERVGIIKSGRLISTQLISNLKNSYVKHFVVSFADEASALKFADNNKDVIEINQSKVTVKVKGNISPLIKTLSSYEVVTLSENVLSLENIFMHFYEGDNNDK